LESELFGHERGAFAGADRQRIGRFELADSGTLFLDEIAEISLATQAKLLRVIQEHEFERVGGEKTIKIDVRVIAATNKDLKHEVDTHRFREDLFYRLNVVAIVLPPLRERKEDISLLAQHFLQRYTKEIGKRMGPLSPSVLKMLEDQPWPGNIRELENAIERAVLMTEGGTIEPKDINFTVSVAADHERGFRIPAGMHLDEIEKQAVLAALHMSGWVQKDAANILGISARVLNYKIKSHHITHPSWIRHKPPPQ
jgi:transcriptional regulator with GAF, ATPase, and Fis domain